MRKIISTLLLTSIAYAGLASAEVIHCDATYQGKPFVQATIWSNTSGFGPAECDYKKPGDIDTISYHFPKQNEYYVVSGNWQSTMPGFQWCNIRDGNQFNTCLFAKRETKE